MSDKIIEKIKSWQEQFGEERTNLLMHTAFRKVSKHDEGNCFFSYANLKGSHKAGPDRIRVQHSREGMVLSLSFDITENENKIEHVNNVLKKAGLKTQIVDAYLGTEAENMFLKRIHLDLGNKPEDLVNKCVFAINILEKSSMLPKATADFAELELNSVKITLSVFAKRNSDIERLI